jgi:hypothetical protein
MKSNNMPSSIRCGSDAGGRDVLVHDSLDLPPATWNSELGVEKLVKMAHVMGIVDGHTHTSA